MRYLSICSGIESATVAWHPLGWEPVAFAEIDPFPCAVLHHHYGSGRPLRMPDPDAPGIDAAEKRRRRAAIKGVAYLPEKPALNGVPNLGDFTQIQSSDLRSDIDLLVGGTPCQDFSVAGLRAGLDGDRGNLSLEFLRLAQRTRPRWLVWENVPGVLSSNGGRDFGAILGGMVELGYGFAYRVLDAQFIRVDGYARAVPQRRRRVFVVGHLGDWRRAAAVLFERACLSGHPAPRREAGESVAATLAARSGGGGHPDGGDGRHSHLIAFSSKDHGADAMVGVSPTLRAMNHDGSHANAGGQIAVAFDTTPAHGHAPAIALGVALRGREEGATAELTGDVMTALRCGGGGGDKPHVLQDAPGAQEAWRVRRLMPVECERLQGFPDGYTDVPYRRRNATPDGPRYKALGNSKAVNVVRWVGMRIAEVDQLPSR